MSARNRRSRREHAAIRHAATHRPLVTGSGDQVSSLVKLPTMFARDAIGDCRGDAPAWVYDRSSSTAADRAGLRRKDVGQHWQESFPDARYRYTSDGFAPTDAVAR